MKACYHLPGLFEFTELYRVFLPLFRTHRDWFYDWCEIGSVYGAPADCLWGGGRVGFGDEAPEQAAALMREYGISARLTFSNYLVRIEHLADKACNAHEKRSFQINCPHFTRSFQKSQAPRKALAVVSSIQRKRFAVHALRFCRIAFMGAD